MNACTQTSSHKRGIFVHIYGHAQQLYTSVTEDTIAVGNALVSLCTYGAVSRHVYENIRFVQNKPARVC
jgi:hypothetical protein